MADYGIKVSQAGYNVLTAAKERLVYSSQYDTFKVFSSGSGTITIAAATDPFTPRLGTVTITHSLGYVPAYFVFVSNEVWASSDRLSPYTFRSIGSTHNRSNYGIDTTDLQINFYNPDSTSSHTYEYRYYIFYNQLG